MQYTLFVDESGDFGHEGESRDWVVGGLLCPMNAQTAESKIGNRLNPIPSQYGLDGREELHRTELNDRVLSGSTDWTFDRVRDLTQSLFRAVHDVSPKARFLAVHRPSRRGLDDPEKTYRLMLLDLIGLADAVLPADRPVERLQLCIATRTQRGERMTGEKDLVQTFQNIEGAVEVDLASRGLLGLLDEEDRTLRPQRDSWLLTVADFWCNAVYNKNRPQSRKIVEGIEASGTGRIFKSGSGSVLVRRALVAERDGNYGLALYRWAVLTPSTVTEARQTEAMQRLCSQIIRITTRSPRPAIEMVIEMLWSHLGESERYADFIGSIRRVGSALASALQESESAVSENALLFRLRNMAHLAANRGGLLETASSLAEKQKNAESLLVHDPASFSLVLDSQIFRVNTLLQSLDHREALDEAQQHRERVQKYGAAWSLLDEAEEESSFRSSRTSLKADITWIRSTVLAAEPGAALDSVLELIERLRDLPMADYDRSRLLNHSITARLKKGWWQGALEEAQQALSPPVDVYGVAHAARAAATCALVDSEAHEAHASRLQDSISDHLIERPGVFPAVAWRDTALLQQVLKEDASAGRQALRKSRSCLSWSTGDATTKIRQWVAWTLDLTGAYLSQGAEMQREVPENLRPFVGRDLLQGKAGLLRARRISPY